MSPRSNRNPALGQRSTLIKHMISTSYKLEPAIWSHGTGQLITWFDRCQLIITWSKAACLCGSIIWRITAILRDSTVVIAAVVRTRSRAILLAMITTRKSIHEFPLVPYMDMGLRYNKILSASTWSPEELNPFKIHLSLVMLSIFNITVFCFQIPRS